MSGMEFDAPALVRILRESDLGAVQSAIRELGLCGESEMETAVAVLEELDDEIRLLRRYRVTQENSLEGLFAVLNSVRLDLVEIIRLWAGIVLGRIENIEEGIALVRGIVPKIREASRQANVNAKATRLARSKLDDLIETRSKIALILG